jgi:hypothetical protein
MGRWITSIRRLEVWFSKIELDRLGPMIKRAFQGYNATPFRGSTTASLVHFHQRHAKDPWAYAAQYLPCNLCRCLRKCVAKVEYDTSVSMTPYAPIAAPICPNCALNCIDERVATTRGTVDSRDKARSIRLLFEMVTSTGLGVATRNSSRQMTGTPFSRYIA